MHYFILLISTQISKFMKHLSVFLITTIFPKINFWHCPTKRLETKTVTNGLGWACINPMNISSKTEPSPLHLEPSVHCALMTLFYTKI